MSSSGTKVSSETQSLLRTRLRAVALIFFLASVAFLVRALLTDRLTLLAADLGLAGILGAVTVLLYSSMPLCLKNLRIVELVIFGSVAFAMAVQDYAIMYQEALGADASVSMSSLVKSILHYALLVFAYGMFIPNTWQRASLLVIPIAITPLAVCSLLRFNHPEFEQATATLSSPEQIGDALLLLAVSVVITLYGTSIINRYRVEAAQAKLMDLYTLKEKIGEGGMGEVWRAEHRMLARPAAIKLIRPEMLGNEDGESALRIIQRFEREAQATAALRSPNTVELYDFGVTHNSVFYYVMEYLEGLDLETLVKRFGPVPPERAIYLLKQVCESLGDAHNSGLIHRDIKPANIYACRMGLSHDFVKVLDFGLVKAQTNGNAATQLTRDGITTGTPAYMAPEMAMKDGQVDARTDLYSLGCVCYWLLTGGLVFDQANPMAMVVDHVKTTPVPPSQRSELEIPSELDDIILKCLEKDSRNRYQSAVELAEVLAACPISQSWDNKRAEEWWQLHRPSVHGNDAAQTLP